MLQPCTGIKVRVPAHDHGQARVRIDVCVRGWAGRWTCGWAGGVRLPAHSLSLSVCVCVCLVFLVFLYVSVCMCVSLCVCVFTL